MSEPAEMAERHSRILAELSELGLTLARDLHQRALAAEDAADAAALGAAFHRLSRSVRQTLALEARLERDRQRAARETEACAARSAEGRAVRRKAQVRAAVERLVWTEAEGEEAERLLDELDARLEEEALYDGFTADPVAAHIARLSAELGLSPICHPRESGDPESSFPLPTGFPAPTATGGGVGVAAALGAAPDHPWRSSA